MCIRNKNMIRTRQMLLVMAVAFTVSVSAAALPVTTVWGPTNDPAGVPCSATATISLLDANTLDIKLTNTSPFMDFGSDKTSAWISRLNFNLPAHFDADADLDLDTSKVRALLVDAVVFSDGKTGPNYNSVVPIDDDRNLDWDYTLNASHADENVNINSNNNALFSLSALSGGIPQITEGGGFLSDAFTGAVFDTIHYYIKVKNDTFSEDDLAFYQDGNLSLHFQSGLDSIWLDNHNPPPHPPTGIPEPSSWMLLLGVFPCGAAWMIRKKLCR